MKRLLFLILFLISRFSEANDGAFYANGGNIFPIKETVIELKKEVLDLTLESGYVNVRVLFHFNNPTTYERTISVGFVTPPPSGDVPNENISGVENFTVKVDGNDLDFELKRITERNLKLGYYGDEFIYLFSSTFKPGITIVEHTYRIKQGSLLNTIFDFNYILATGLTWANDQIEDFTLNINFESPTYYSLPKCLVEDRSNWKFNGDGNFSNMADLVNNTFVYRGYTTNGTLQCKATNFKPKCDIQLSTWSDFFSIYQLSSGDMSNELDAKIVQLVRNQIDKSDARTLRNLLFAIHGYKFKSADLSSLFNEQYWYVPDETVVSDVGLLRSYEKKLFEYVKSVESN